MRLANTPMETQALNLLKSKYFFVPVTLLSAVFVSTLTYFTGIKEKVIFPKAESFEYACYTDEANGGNSQVLNYSVSDSVIDIEFKLNDQFYSPYVGLILSPKNQNIINVEKYNQISLTVSGRDIDRIGISLYNPALKPGESSEETLFHSYLNINDQRLEYDIPLSEFQVPDWWADLHQLGDSPKTVLDHKNILHINIGTAFTPQIDQEKNIKIYRLAFTRNNQKLFVTLGIIYFILVLANIGILYLKNKRKKTNAEVVITYKSLEIKDLSNDNEKCIEYINLNYSQSDLTLEIIAEATATTPRKITKIINDRFQCNFKTYLNRIRINEAKRLLTESDLNIGEISFKVGFNNQSHFNRVFKSETGKSPSEYRENSH